jgi:predicted O-linked N-acetylglucosamine transferase (SPINDLY family)
LEDDLKVKQFEWEEMMNETCQNFTIFRETSSLLVAKKINDDGVAILVDFGGHLSRASASVLVLRPAPIQVRFVWCALEQIRREANLVINDAVFLGALATRGILRHLRCQRERAVPALWK